MNSELNSGACEHQQTARNSKGHNANLCPPWRRGGGARARPWRSRARPRLRADASARPCALLACCAPDGGAIGAHRCLPGRQQCQPRSRQRHARGSGAGASGAGGEQGASYADGVRDGIEVGRAAGLRAGVQRGQSDVLKVGVTGVACLVVLVALVRRYAEPCDDGDGARCGAVVAGVAGALSWVAALAGTRAHVARDEHAALVQELERVRGMSAAQAQEIAWLRGHLSGNAGADGGDGAGRAREQMVQSPAVHGALRQLDVKVDLLLADSRARGHAGAASRGGGLCWVEAPERDLCSMNAATLQCMPPDVLAGSSPLYYSDVLTFVQCVYTVLSTRLQCVSAARHAPQLVARECWRFAKVWGAGSGGNVKGDGNVSGSATLRSLAVVEPLAYCVLFVGASCRAHLAMGAMACCEGGD